MKRISLLFIAILLFISCVLLTSCVAETYIVSIEPDGGDVVKEQVITKETYEMLISSGADASDFTDNGGKIEFFTKENIDYVRLSSTSHFDSLSELNYFLSNVGEASTSTSVSSNKFFQKFNISLDETAETLICSGTISQINEFDVYTSCTLILKFPGEILKSNIGTKTDDNSLEIDMLDAWKNNPLGNFTIKANASSQSNALIYILIGIGVLIVIGIVVFLLMKKSKNSVVIEVGEENPIVDDNAEADVVDNPEDNETDSTDEPDNIDVEPETTQE